MNHFTFAKLLLLRDQGNKSFSVGIKNSEAAILWLIYNLPEELFVHTRFSLTKLKTTPGASEAARQPQEQCLSQGAPLEGNHIH